ncbi:MAG: pilus assembly PilX N-terminal domain-containing protein [Candidatus Xenobiia bacterium LiM19]
MKRNRKGIVIITTMLLLSVIIMIAALLVVTGRSTLLLGASYSDREQAYYAAECGIAYAQHCISKCKDWVSNETTLDKTIYDPGFTDFSVSAVGSQKNCVRGVFNSNGSEFYITFYSGTWNDSTSPRKDVDRSGNLGTPLKYYSINNISSDSTEYSEYLDDAGKGKTFRTVPGGYAHIIVEGRCNQVRRYAEAFLQKVETETGMACSIAAGGFNIDLADNDSVFLVDAASGYESRIRSMGDITLTSGGNGKKAQNDKNCYRIADNGLSCTGLTEGGSEKEKYTNINGEQIDSNEDQTAYGVACENKSQNDYLNNAKLEWGDVTEKYISGTSYNSSKVKTTIAAGTYVYMNSSSEQSKYDLYYFPTSASYDPEAGKNADSHPDNFVNKNISSAKAYSSDLVSSSQSGDLTIASTVSTTQLTAGNYLITAANPIGIEPDKTGGNFAVAVYDYDSETGKYCPSSNYRASVKLDGTEEQDPCLISHSEGSIYIEGELSGKGKIMCGNELSFQGKSLLEADTDSSNGVSIYAQGSVNIDPVKGSGGAGDPNDDIKEAWNALISNNSFSNSGDYYDSNLTSYKDLQKMLLKTSITGANGKSASLYDVLKSDYGYDKAAIQELINTVMSKNTYIGKDSSSTGSEASFAKNTGGTYECGEYSYKIITDNGASSHCHMTIIDSNGVSVKFCTMGGMHYDGSNNTLAGGFQASSIISNSYVSFDSSTATWALNLGGAGKTNSDDSDTIMMHKTTSGFEDLSFNDTILKGLVYTWKDFKARDLGGGSLSIRGGIVAYGGDPSSDDPGANGYGKVSLNNGKYVTFTYDPDYMKLIFDLSAGITTKRVMQNAF